MDKIKINNSALESITSELLEKMIERYEKEIIILDDYLMKHSFTLAQEKCFYETYKHYQELIPSIKKILSKRHIAKSQSEMSKKIYGDATAYKELNDLFKLELSDKIIEIQQLKKLVKLKNYTILALFIANIMYAIDFYFLR